MSDNVGLSTPRGSGTSGYVQRNLAHMRPRDRDRAAPYPRDLDHLKHRQRQPDKGILEHDRKREIEVKVFELRDQLEDEGIEEEEIDRRCDALRTELREKMNNNNNHNKSGSAGAKKGLKSHQVHELADAKIKESERLRSALKISRDYEEGGHWKRQEERLRKALDREFAAEKRDDRG
ncbi:cwf21-domain-containing protein [Xylaria bambusicola]|uniref:cwf21-domain-containing protein n=1 Tax=Xylaria bambusicola TaxID=326684 RepID=UPI002008A4B6|nr:cwf21-domain-containing protein [Xylaria bambusicola]KAI0512758.1 cwf21-domain-containing protein [Xylaria bambusicola]